MDKKTNSIGNIIRRFQKQLKLAGIDSKVILLYGSYACGNSSEGSDIDLIVISEGWKTYSMLERLEILGVASARILEPIQAVGFTPEEIEGQEILPFWQDIIKHAQKAA